MASSRFWIFTANNPVLPLQDPPIDFSLRRNVEFAVYQLEQGAEGTVHIQGYVCYRRHVRRSTVKNLIFRCLGTQPHLEQRRGSHLEVNLVFSICRKAKCHLTLSLSNYSQNPLLMDFLRPKPIIRRKTPVFKALGGIPMNSEILLSSNNALANGRIFNASRSVYAMAIL